MCCTKQQLPNLFSLEIKAGSEDGEVGKLLVHGLRALPEIYPTSICPCRTTHWPIKSQGFVRLLLCAKTPLSC